MESKANFRLAMKERLARMGENDRRVESQILVRELKKYIDEKQPRSIGIYIPFKDEPNIRPLIEWLLEKKCTVSMPHVQKADMHFVHIRTLGDIGTSVMGTPESREDERVNERSMDIILVPGRAFTKEGNRMGRGNGGYDRWIQEQRKRNTETKFIGVCFDCQLVQEVPVEAHDEKVDAVRTPSKLCIVY